MISYDVFTNTKRGVVEGFTKRHDVKTLVYFEAHDQIEDALKREKILKRWNRDWKIALIERDNPRWVDLYQGIGGRGPRLGEVDFVCATARATDEWILVSSTSMTNRAV